MPTPFPPNKTFAELGLDPKRKFVVVDDGHDTFNKGDILEWVRNEYYYAPWFRRISDGKEDSVFLSRLAYADEPKTWYNLEKGDVLEHDEYGEKTIQGYVGDILFALDEDAVISYDDIQYWKKRGWRIKDAQPEERTVEDVLNDLSEEDKEIIKKAMKLPQDSGFKITKE